MGSKKILHLQTLRVPVPDPNKVAYDRDQWGRQVKKFGAPDAEHIDIWLRRAPEGPALLALCRACGGRHEGLLDAQSADGVPDAPGLPAADTAFLAVLGTLIGSFMPDHLGCVHKPRRHHLPSAVQSVLDRRMHAARRSLRRGSMVDPSVSVVLTSPQRELLAPVPAMPEWSEDEVERRCQTEEFVCTLRRLIRSRGWDVLGAVLTCEARPPKAPAGSDASEHGCKGPDEALVSAVITPDFGRYGWASIGGSGSARHGGTRAAGQLAWSAIKEPIPLLDGILATTDVVPLTEEARRLAAGEAGPVFTIQGHVGEA